MKICKFQKKRVGRPPKSEVHGIKLRKPIRDTKFTPGAQTTGPRIALAKGTKRALGSPDEEPSAKVFFLKMKTTF